VTQGVNQRLGAFIDVTLRRTFRHLGEDNQGNPILLMNRIEALNDIPGPPEPPS